VSLNLTSAGLDQLLSDLREQGYEGSRQHLEHLVLKASSTSGLGLFYAGLEQLVLEKRFVEESVQSFRQVIDFWSKRFHYASVQMDHNYRFDVHFWKPVDSRQIQESARFFLSLLEGRGEIIMKLRDQVAPERRTLQLERVKALQPASAPPSAAPETVEPVKADPQPADWAVSLVEELGKSSEGEGDGDSAPVEAAPESSC
jgi:hypothetical protein